MNVLIAPDKFKDALTAQQACGLIAEGLREARPDWSADICPLTDGGEGFARILTDAVRGCWRELRATGPRGAEVVAGFGLVDIADLPAAVRARLAGLPEHGLLAVIEMAMASGLALLREDERDVWWTDTRGTGELMAAAVDAGAAGILLGVGGSATHDLGLGALRALGANWEGGAGDGAPGGWQNVTRVNLENVRPMPPVWIGCDVVNPLLGPNGAAAVYAKQKGASVDALARLDEESRRMAAMMTAQFDLTDAPGAGAAGGIAFGLMAALGARLIPGYELVADWLGLDARIQMADMVVTAEGRFDDSSLSGKGAGSLVRSALAAGKTVHVFAGRVDVSRSIPGMSLHELSPRDEPLAQSLTETGVRLRENVRAAFLC